VLALMFTIDVSPRPSFALVYAVWLCCIALVDGGTLPHSAPAPSLAQRLGSQVGMLQLGCCGIVVLWCTACLFGMYRRARRRTDAYRIMNGIMLFCTAGYLVMTLTAENAWAPFRVALALAMLLTPVWLNRPTKPDDLVHVTQDFRWGSVDLLGYGMKQLQTVGLTLRLPLTARWAASVALAAAAGWGAYRVVVMG
jgi:hypothetical protein